MTTYTLCCLGTEVVGGRGGGEKVEEEIGCTMDEFDGRVDMIVELDLGVVVV